MCQYCSEHKRKKWFLDEDNYMGHLLQDKKRQNVLQKLSGYTHEYELRNFNDLLYHTRHPILHHTAKYFMNKLSKESYAGQVVTLEDAFKVIELADHHVLFECACRHLIGDKSEHICINFGPMRDLIKTGNPNEKIIEVDTYETKKILQECHDKGYFHEVYFAKAPFPVTLCNCDRKYCIALKDRFIYNFKSALYKGHEVARINPDKCKCGENLCMSRCQFGAMYVDITEDKVVVDPIKCFGCGLCIDACPNKAISMVDRNDVPEAAGKW